MQRLLKNLEYAAALPLAAQVYCQPGQVTSKTLVQNNAVSVTLLAFDKGEEINAHTSAGDALVGRILFSRQILSKHAHGEFHEDVQEI